QESSFFFKEIDDNAPLVIILNKNLNDSINVLDINRYIRKNSNASIRNSYLLLRTDKGCYDSVVAHINQAEKIFYYDKELCLDLKVCVSKIKELIASLNVQPG
ncbi:MAG TPA: hypothetical protein VIH57_08905, partial [Bacteroidales bacterium]